MNITVFLLRNVQLLSFEFFNILLKAYVIGFFISVIIPINFISNKIAFKLKILYGTIPFNIIQGIISTLVFNTIVGASMVLLDIGFSTIFWAVFLTLYPRLLLIGFFVGYFTAPLSMKLTEWFTRNKVKRD